MKKFLGVLAWIVIAFGAIAMFVFGPMTLIRLLTTTDTAKKKQADDAIAALQKAVEPAPAK